MSSQPPSIATLSQRLTSLSSLILERSRVISLGLPASASTDTQILRGLSVVRDGILRLQDELDIEKSGLVVGSSGGRSDVGRAGSGLSLGRNRISFNGQRKDIDLAALKGLEDRYDRVIGMMEADEVGKSKVSGLRRPLLPESRPQTPPPKFSNTFEDPLAAPQSRSAVESPSSPRSPSPTNHSGQERFRDDPTPGPSRLSDEFNAGGMEDPLSGATDRRTRSSGVSGHDAGTPYEEAAEDDRSDHQLLQTQRDLMSEQDQRLSLLSNSISRQNHLSIQIGSELDLHSDLLDDTELAMDRTHDRLTKARGRLDKVAKGAKAYGSTITIVALILILLILIIAFKT